jgi:hypothetical protein
VRLLCFNQALDESYQAPQAPDPCHSYGGVSSKRTAWSAQEQAGKFCVAQGKYLIIRNQNVIQEIGHDIATVNFSCVTADDPEYQRPNLRKDDGVLTVNH